ncbi:hypothetical protein TNCV_5114931 [Trichonephila clavipes]|nr:hypothetical protein TNCV_5114931 [Trichonephila clavipes]
MPKKNCALHKGVTKWPILEESVANWVLENRLNGLIVTRNSVRLFALKWSKRVCLFLLSNNKSSLGVLCLLTPSSQAKIVSQRLAMRIPDEREGKRRTVTLRCSFRLKWGLRCLR